MSDFCPTAPAAVVRALRQEHKRILEEFNGENTSGFRSAEAVHKRDVRAVLQVIRKQSSRVPEALPGEDDGFVYLPFESFSLVFELTSEGKWEFAFLDR